MDFLKKFSSEATGNDTTATEKKGSTDHPDASQAELFSSAKVVADAARATFQKEPNKADNAKVAGASADLLDAAERYGKLDTSTGIGSYVEKAENYLHQYESSHSTTPAKTPEEPGKKTNIPPKSGEPATTTPASKETEPPAQGFLNKESEGKSTESGSGYGDMMKMAGGFLKKN